MGRYIADPDYLNSKEMSVLREWYGATVSYLNDQLANFFEYYKNELQSNTILILTADHGEQLGEHGLLGHSYKLFDETLHIPLIITGPNIPQGRSSALISHVDLFSTLCNVCGLDNIPNSNGLHLFSDETREAVFMEYGERNVNTFINKTAHGRYLSKEEAVELTAGRKAVRTKDYRFEMTSNGKEQLYEIPQNTKISSPNIASDLRKRLVDELGEEFGAWPEGDP